MSYGATQGDWTHFDLILGLTEDLLPVVSNPTATISESSKIKELGKTPSKYNGQGRAAGIAKWTSHRSTCTDVDFWGKTPDYGICLQTRHVRAMDIDIADEALAREVARVVIESLCLDLLCETPAVRHRSNSGKRLVAFALPGEYAKRRITVAGGVIEFLATGQQFVAVGTHPSGVRYEWDGGLPSDIVVITPEAFEHMWSVVVAQFAIGEVAIGKVGQQITRPRGVEVTDPVLPFLRAEGWVRDVESDGKVHIRCPFEDEHSTRDGSETGTTYFPAGVGGFAQGHFRCLHAHCEGRSDSEFMDAIGYVASQFETLPDTIGEDGEADQPLPKFRRNKAGEIEATLTEIVAALRSVKAAGWRIAYDTFKDEILMSTTKGKLEQVQWRAMTDADYTRLRLRLESIGFKPVGRELMRDAVMFIASEIQIDSAMLWLQGLKWDGIPRVDKFLTQYFGAVGDAQYLKEVSRYIWTAHAGRILVPGCQADMMTIFCGDQGIRKSSGIAAMAPSIDQFTELSFSEINHDNIARKMRGMVVAEFAEMDGLHGRDIESTKKFVTRRHEQWVPKFKEFTTTFSRRLVMHGSSNSVELLDDPTGNRRWLPVQVTAVDTLGIMRDRNQLWAEGAALFLQNGIAFREAERLARNEHAAFAVTDMWDDSVSRWLELQLAERGQDGNLELAIDEILWGSLGISPRDARKAEQLRIGKVLKRMGWNHKRKYVLGCQRWVWVKVEKPLKVEDGSDLL